MLPALLLVLVALLTPQGANDPHKDITVRRVPAGGIQPEAVRDRDGVIHLLYFAGEPAAGDLYYVRSTDDGATFTLALRVNSEPLSAIATGTIRGGQLAIGRGGRAHVVWNGSGKARTKGPADPATGQTGAQMFYSRLNDAGTGFEPQRGLVTRTLQIDGGGSVAADHVGNVYVAWHGNDARGAARDEATRVVWLTRSTDDGRRFRPEAMAWKQGTGVCGCCALELFTDGPTVSLMYRSATGGVQRDIYMLTSNDRGRTFRGANIHPWKINACPMTSMSFAVTGRRLLAAWETEGQVFMSQIDRATSRATSIAEPIAATAPGKHPRLAVDKDRVLLAWAEGTGWARGGFVAWQVFDQRGEPTGKVDRLPGVPVWSFPATVSRTGGGFIVFY